MNSGALRHRVTLQAPYKARGTHGGAKETWTDMATSVPADVRDTAGRNIYTSSREGVDITVEVRIRHRKDVAKSWRVIHGDRTLEVVYPQDPDGRRRDLVLYCKEIA